MQSCRIGENPVAQNRKKEKDELNYDKNTDGKDINATGSDGKYDCIYCQRKHVKKMRNCSTYGQEYFRC